MKTKDAAKIILIPAVTKSKDAKVRCVLVPLALWPSVGRTWDWGLGQKPQGHLLRGSVPTGWRGLKERTRWNSLFLGQFWRPYQWKYIHLAHT